MNKKRWRNFTEYALMLGSGAGVVASATTQQVLYASAPLTLLVAMGLVKRRQLEAMLQKDELSFEDVEQRFTQKLDQLQEKVMAMPSPESLTNFQRSVVAHSDRAIVRFSQEMQKTKQQIESRLQLIEAPDLTHLQEDMAQLQDQYTYLCSSLHNLTNHVQRLSTLPRVEATEAEVSDLKTNVMQVRVSLESLGSETRTVVSHLQDQVQHFERRLRQVPISSDSNLLKEEVRELIKAIADLVPRREFATLVNKLNDVSEQQTALQASLFELGRHGGVPIVVDPLPSVDGDSVTQAASSPNSGVDGALPEAVASEGLEVASGSDTGEPSSTTLAVNWQPEMMQATLTQLTEGLAQLDQQVEVLTSQPDLETTVQERVSTYLSHLEWQLANMQQFAQVLTERQKALSDSLNHLPSPLDAAALHQQVTSLRSRLDTTETAVSQVQQRLEAEPTVVPNGRQPQWIIDVRSQQPSATSASRLALEEAIQATQERLVLVWPWAENCLLDEALVAQFQALLDRRCVLDIGWCHLGDRPEGRYVPSISQQWGLESSSRQLLKQALRQLLPLKQSHPDRFRFKILGTDENFLVSDRSLAILGVQSLEVKNTAFSQVDLKLKTQQPEVVNRLLSRFDSPVLNAEDAVAYFNRGCTRYELGDFAGAVADLSHVLELHPNDASTFNQRGVVHSVMGELQEAMVDLSHAIQCDSAYFPAYCNRGVLRTERREFPGAISDFNVAIRLQPQSAIPYFYRGAAMQQMGDLSAAIVDYTTAIERNPEAVFPYCYRGMAYQKQGRLALAIADLETAADYFRKQDDAQNLSQVLKTLNKLRAKRATQQKSQYHPGYANR